MAKLVVEDLSFAFGPVDVLEDINFELNSGEALSIIGPSGGGKSTLLRLVAGLLDIDQGEIKNTFTNQSIAFQDSRLLPWANTIDNISLGLRARGVCKKEAKKRSEDAALRLGLETEDFAKFPKDLSGGMRQRVSFARALVTKPDILFLDEPFSALDIGLKRELWSILSEEVSKNDLALLFITHDLMEAVRLSHTVLLLDPEPIGHIVHRFSPSKNLPDRDDDFVYESVAKLLSDPKIIKTFELKV